MKILSASLQSLSFVFLVFLFSFDFLSVSTFMLTSGSRRLEFSFPEYSLVHSLRRRIAMVARNKHNKRKVYTFCQLLSFLIFPSSFSALRNWNAKNEKIAMSFESSRDLFLLSLLSVSQSVTLEQSVGAMDIHRTFVNIQMSNKKKTLVRRYHAQ